MTSPNSTELQDRLTRVLEAARVAHEASTRRDAFPVTAFKTDEYRAANRDSMLAHQALGAAEEDMRSAIRMAATVLDHAHACDKPTPAGLLRENTSLRAEVARLREQVETLGGNADRPLRAV